MDYVYEVKSFNDSGRFPGANNAYGPLTLGSILLEEKFKPRRSLL